MTRQKYILTKETCELLGHTLHRIQAVRDFADVKSGDLGGFVESTSNLSQSGNCWVYDNACVFGNALVSIDAKVKDHAVVYNTYTNTPGDSRLNRTSVSDSAVVENRAIVRNRAMIKHFAVVSGNAIVENEVQLTGHSFVGYDSIITQLDEFFVEVIDDQTFVYTCSNRMWQNQSFIGNHEQFEQFAQSRNLQYSKAINRVKRFESFTNQISE
jgi:conserved hypothetical protein